MKNLWIVNQYANTINMPGHTRQRDLGVFFIKRGYKVKIFASDFNLSMRKYYKKNKKFFFKSEIEEKINWIWLSCIKYKENNWLRYLNIFSFLINLLINIFFRLLIRSENKPDVIIYSSPQLPAAIICLIISKFLKIPFIFEVRDLWPKVLIDIGHIREKSIIYRLLSYIESIIYKHSSCVVVLSKGCINHVTKFGARKVFFFPNGPDLKDFKYFPLPKEDKEFSVKRPFKIVYSGAHGRVNDLETIIKAAYLLEEYPIKFHLIGDGPEKSKIMRLALNSKNVFFDSSIPKKKMPKYLANFDAIIITLLGLELFKYGVSPNKLYDAYAIGRPVITAIPGIVNEEVEYYGLGVTAPAENPHLLAKKIKKLYLKSRIEREAMSRSARKVAEKFYSREKISNEYINLIDNFILNKTY